jgi:hypothetical protein
MPRSLESEERPQRTINPVTQRMFPRISIQDELRQIDPLPVVDPYNGDEAPLGLHEIQPQTISRRILIIDDETFNQVDL